MVEFYSFTCGFYCPKCHGNKGALINSNHLICYTCFPQVEMVPYDREFLGRVICGPLKHMSFAA